MRKTITKEHVRALLNNSDTNILHITTTLKQYFLQPQVKNPLLNKLRKHYLNNQVKNIPKWFIEENIELVSNTALCQTKYKAQILLKTVWQMLGELQSELITNIKNNIILDEPENKLLTKLERQRKQAELMRAAKARKREERLKLEKENIDKS